MSNIQPEINALKKNSALKTYQLSKKQPEISALKKISPLKTTQLSIFLGPEANF